ncbi:hypothetical protein [Xanthomarina gelatinilytica]|uniref:hypothetical protein n=1 Tax=Xanthomarina gelatinilytica TaxID=1137281 RepID=UPI003AA8BD12
MSAPTFEMIAKPKIDQAAARKMATDSKEAISNATKQASAETKANLDKAISGGIKSGGKEGFGKLKEFGNTFAGEFGGKLSLTVAGIATAAAAVIADTMAKTLGGADEVADRLRERMNAQRQVELTGSAFGMSSGRYAAFVEGAQAMGLEMEDITGMMSGFVGSLSRPEMVKYKELTDKVGTEGGFIDLLQKAASMDRTQSQQFLDSTLGGDDSVKAGMFVNKIREMNEKGLNVNLDSIASYLTGRNVVSADITKDIEAQKPYQDKVYRHDAYLFDKHLRQQLSNQDVADINSRSDSKESVDDANKNAFHVKVETANALDSITVNQINTGKIVAEEAAKGAELTMKSLSEYLELVLKASKKQVTFNYKDPFGGNNQAANQATKNTEDVIANGIIKGLYEYGKTKDQGSLGSQHSIDSNKGGR